MSVQEIVGCPVVCSSSPSELTLTMASPLTLVTITLMLATLGAAENVEIDLFYESLCPYSVE